MSIVRGTRPPEPLHRGLRPQDPDQGAQSLGPPLISENVRMGIHKKNSQGEREGIFLFFCLCFIGQFFLRSFFPKPFFLRPFLSSHFFRDLFFHSHIFPTAGKEVHRQAFPTVWCMLNRGVSVEHLLICVYVCVKSSGGINR